MWSVRSTLRVVSSLPDRPDPGARRAARLGADRVDVVLAAVLLVVGLAQVVVWPIAARGVGELYVVGATLPLAWRRTYPVESSLVAAAFWLIPLDGFPVLGFVTVVLQFFALGAWATSRRAVLLVTAFASATAVVGTLLGPEEPVAAVGAVLVVVAPAIAGRVVRHLRGQNRALAELAVQLRVERHRAEEAAVAVERGRIAQELHDVVGHELTLIAIQAEAAASALRSSPERAAEPVEAIRSTAHRALEEIRGVLDLLDPQEAEPAGGDLTELSRRAGSAGIRHTLDVVGTPWPDHAPPAMAVSRILRECLTNAGRHAPGQPVTVLVDWGPHEVRVRASNPVDRSARPTPGRGLTGMRHRAELLHGTFDVTCEDHTFVVEATLPAPREAR